MRAENKSTKTTTSNQGHRSLPKESWGRARRKRSTLVSYDWSRDAPASCLTSLTAAIYPASSPFSLHLCELRVSRLTLPFTIHSFPSSFHFVKSFTVIHSWLSLLLPSKYNQNVTTSRHTHSLRGSSPSSLTEVDCSKTSSFMVLLPLYSPSMTSNSRSF